LAKARELLHERRVRHHMLDGTASPVSKGLALNCSSKPGLHCHVSTSSTMHILQTYIAHIPVAGYKHRTQRRRVTPSTLLLCTAVPTPLSVRASSASPTDRLDVRPVLPSGVQNQQTHVIQQNTTSNPTLLTAGCSSKALQIPSKPPYDTALAVVQHSMEAALPHVRAHM
jgi:hypothetical protein